jgi:uncharacterized protein (UPF0332 family)
MRPDDSTQKDLAAFRLHQARECLQDAQAPVISSKTAANRSYYCIFNAMRAVLALERFDSKKHSGIISAFRKNYIKTGVFPADFSDIIEEAFVVRNESDYEAFYIVSKESVATQVKNAETFLRAVEKYVEPFLSPP